MQIKKILLTGMVLALNLWSAYAQSGKATVTGKVKDESGNPIPGAIIQITAPKYLLQQMKTAFSNSKGLVRANNSLSLPLRSA